MDLEFMGIWLTYYAGALVALFGFIVATMAFVQACLYAGRWFMRWVYDFSMRGLENTKNEQLSDPQSQSQRD